MTKAGYRGTNHARAASWETWPTGSTLVQPRFGAVTVFCNHVGFFCFRSGPDVYLLGGNQPELGEEHQVRRRVAGRCPPSPPSVCKQDPRDCVCIEPYPLDAVVCFKWPSRQKVKRPQKPR
jgi:hypothetical protein